MQKWLAMVLLAAFTLGACATASTNPATKSAVPAEGKTIFVARHLQKAEGEDPPLSDEGAAASKRLAEMLRSEGISAIFATPTRRAMETAAPLSRLAGVPITQYDPRNPQPLAARIAGAEGSVLVVGHSNTVHHLIALFGGHPPPPLTEQDYGTVFIIDAKGGVRTVEVD